MSIMSKQLHMNFISAIHTTAFNVLREHSEPTTDDKQKVLFEQMCEVRLKRQPVSVMNRD